MKKDQKLAIIAAAEEVMSLKSLVGSKITDIAQKADITESLIYKYFNGK
jgi:AcrR family transcriptional regulator